MNVRLPPWSLIASTVSSTASISTSAGSNGSSGARAVTCPSRAHTCAACHGTYGELKGEHFVPLAGMDEGEFITSMKEFRSHKRPSSIMSHIAEGYSDEEFERMARYFNGIRIKGDVK